MLGSPVSVLGRCKSASIERLELDWQEIRLSQAECNALD